MINGRASPYECVKIELYTDDGPYQGNGLIRRARLGLSSERVTTARIPQKTIELIVQSTGLTKVERKIKNRLRAERITIPQNLRTLMTTSYKDNKEQISETKSE